MPPRWPHRAQIAIRKLFEPLQDIDVYVEDENDEAFYRALLNFSARNKVQVARVFGLGGRQNVVSEAAAYASARRALFIIDGDYHWVRGEEPPELDHLHQHEAYCVENLLFCEQAIATIFSQETGATEAEAAARIGYVQWRNSISELLVNLVASYATVNHFEPSFATLGQGVGVLCTNWKLDASKIEAAKQAALSYAGLNQDPAVVGAKFQEIRLRISAFHEPLDAASGKHILLPLLGFLLGGLGCRVRPKPMRIRLAGAGRPERFAGLAAALVECAQGL